MKREESRVKERNVRRIVKNIGMLIIGLTALSVLGGVFLSVFIERNKDLGLINSITLQETLIEGRELPWATYDSKTVAVIDCKGEKFFLKINDVIDEKFSGCKYYLSQNTVLTPSFNLFNSEPKILLSINE